MVQGGGVAVGAEQSGDLVAFFYRAPGEDDLDIGCVGGTGKYMGNGTVKGIHRAVGAGKGQIPHRDLGDAGGCF